MGEIADQIINDLLDNAFDGLEDSRTAHWCRLRAKRTGCDSKMSVNAKRAFLQRVPQNVPIDEIMDAIHTASKVLDSGDAFYCSEDARYAVVSLLRELENGLWIDAEGCFHYLKDMGDAHLLNVCRICSQKGRVFKSKEIAQILLQRDMTPPEEYNYLIGPKIVQGDITRTQSVLPPAQPKDLPISEQWSL